MAFDIQTRNRLARLVADCRDLLTAEFDAKLQEFYGIYASEGRILTLDKLVHLDDERLNTARLLRERIDHIVATDPSGGLKEAVGRVLREQAFTILNRLAALRMAEERGIIVESIGGGLNSKAFKAFSQVAFSGLGDAYERYRVFLHCAFDELANDLGTLFDRSSPYGLLFPRQDVLLKLFGNLNAPDLKGLWREDETIGWVYQYYNDPSERKKMREESSAPRNSRELAVRNQFFTPRYVVEFLADNTLGRLWYEMTRGETAMSDRCRYLSCVTAEIFLEEGQSAEVHPNIGGTGQESLREDLLHKPVSIPHRPLKDPRMIRVLDPACGSMHFGLYAFDLFERIYDEAWDIARGSNETLKSAPLFAPFISFAAKFANKAGFLREVPSLIVEHNLHGIDIDPRAAQIAGLSLWLRAHRTWQRAGVTPAERPRITRSNLVCAEPMPGEKELLREFVEGAFLASERPAFALLMGKIFDWMALAGEAGSLLRIEEEIRTAVVEARALAQRQSAPRQTALFGSTELQGQEEFDLRGLTDEQFWEKAEGRIYDALETYAEQAGNSGGYQRRLFANDAVQGFAFIDLCRKRYDIVVMNPPFGDASLPSKQYIDDTYGDTKGDVYKAFVECFQTRIIPAGYLGVISSRTGFFLSQSEDWRTRVVLRLFRPIALADLGSGVLDAMVEVAAYVLRNLSELEASELTLSLVPVLELVARDQQDRFSLPKWQAARGGLKRHQVVVELERLKAAGFVQRCSGDIVRYTPLWHAVKAITAAPLLAFPPLVCVRALAEADKALVLSANMSGATHDQTFICDPATFQSVPGSPFAYWTTAAIRQLFADLPSVEGNGRDVESGASTKSDFRFLRLRFERPESDAAVIRDGLVASGAWVPFAKGGAVTKFYGDLNLTVQWRDNGAELKALISEYRGSRGWGYQWTAELKVMAFSFRPGVTWGRRSTSLAFRLLPRNSMFADKGPAILGRNDTTSDLLALAAIVNSRPFAGLVAIQSARVELAQSFEVGLIQSTPFPKLCENDTEALAALSRRIWLEKRALDTTHSTSHAFLLPALLVMPGSTLMDRAVAWDQRARASEEMVAAIQAEIDEHAFRLYGLGASDRAALSATTATESTVDAEASEDREQTTAADGPALVASLLDYSLGAAFGRWDVRLATGRASPPPEPNPFEALPVCPPGMLQRADGIPISTEEGRQLQNLGQYPIDVAWEGILVDDSEHALDLERHIHSALQVLWPRHADDLEREACLLLGVPSLREWFRRPTGFFSDHLTRHSKSRRQAPIYWPLSTPSGSYTLWIYYHRLSDQTLFHCVNGFVKPKIVEIEADLSRIMAASGDERTKRDEVERLTIFRSELSEFREELLRVAQLPYKPNLNDGVLLTAAPLWRLFCLPKWQKSLKEAWEELSSGKYDWSHLALTLWPERVKKNCESDRSLAIAHGLEAFCKTISPSLKSKKSGKKLLVEVE